VSSALQRSLTSPFKGDNGSNNYYKDVMLALFRTNLGNLNLAQDRYMNGGSSTSTYLRYAKEHGFEPESITLPSGTQAHWLGSKSAKKVLVYFNGKTHILNGRV
jgi:hypothetical protein